MAKVKTNNLVKKICDNCHGNGFVKIKPSNYMLKLLGKKPNSVENVHQCWVCDSEGEVYEERTDLIDDNPFSNKLH